MAELDLSEEISDQELLARIDRVLLRQGRQRSLSVGQRAACRKQLFDSFRRLDILQELVEDESITEIMVNGTQAVFLEKDGRLRCWDRRFTSAEKLADVIQRTFDRGGNVVIPSFAVGRTQELLYFLRRVKEEGMVTGHGDFPVYVDSPMAVEATNIFRENQEGYYDREAMDLIRRGVNPLGVSNLRLSVSSDDSKEINSTEGCKVILSASGMCEAGRIKHHLKHNLWRPECTILFVGYQAQGTLGRAILEGADSVKLFGEEIEVCAEICQLNGVSGHADNNGLLRWVRSFSPQPRRVFVVHGESSVCDLFAMRLRDEFGFSATAPYPGACYDLERNFCLEEGTRERVRREAPTRRAAAVFQRLIDAGKRLMVVIRHNEGGANKDLARFADQINALCDKWDR